VQASRNANAFQRLILDELFANALQHGHRLIRPLDAPLALVGKLHAFHVERNLGCDCCSHDLLVQKAAVVQRLYVLFFVIPNRLVLAVRYPYELESR
jgi:hypothetical protein